MADPRNLAIANTWRGKTTALTLVTTAADGSEVSNASLRLVKSTRRVLGKTVLELVDVDVAALDGMVPSKTFTVANWPNLFVDHVNRPISQGVGQMRKVPLTYVDNTAGAYKYAGPEVIGSPATLQTLYREGRIVDPSEYTASTATAGGVTVVTVTFAKEQKDFNGKLYDLTADFSCPGSRLVSNEIKRILELVGLTTIAASFTAAATWSTTENILVDCGYVQPRKAIVIIQDLLAIARAQLYRDSAGAWGLFIDQARAAVLTLDDSIDECSITDYVRPEIASSIVLEYRPSRSDKEEFTGLLSRACNGSAGEVRYKNPYINDHETADRTLCYLQKRENAKATALATIHAVQLTPGDVVTMKSDVLFGGTKSFAAPVINRPPDANDLQLLEYDASIYTYTAGTLPSDATSGYQPDYSQTPPAAPTGLAVLHQGTSSNTDGVTKAFAVIRALPPAVNWQHLKIQVRDTTTNEIYQAQLRPITDYTISAVNTGTDRITLSSPLVVPVNSELVFGGSLPSPLVAGVTYYCKTDVGGGVIELSATPGGALINLTTATTGGTVTFPALGATIAGLRPNRAHKVIAWAVNGNNVDGAATAEVSFTSANYTTQPAAPASISVTQQSPHQMRVAYARVSDVAGAPKIRRYIIFRQIDSGGYSEIARTDQTEYIDDNLIAGPPANYQYKARSEDVNGNESNDSSVASQVIAKIIDDNMIAGQGVGGGSIANSSINRGRSDTASTSLSGTLNNGFTTYVTMDVYTFFPAQWVGGSGPNCFMLPYTTDPGNDQGTFGWYNNTGSNQSWGVRYRKFQS